MTAPRYLHPGDYDYNGVRDAVVRLRCRGYGQDRIAKEVGIPKQVVKNLLESEFRDRYSEREALKHQTAMQIDYIMRPLLDKYEKDAEKGQPQRGDAETLLKCLDRRARLFGLDDAVKLNVQVEEMTNDQLQQQLAVHGIDITLPQLPAAPASEPVEDAEVVSVGEAH